MNQLPRTPAQYYKQVSVNLNWLETLLDQATSYDERQNVTNLLLMEILKESAPTSHPTIPTVPYVAKEIDLTTARLDPGEPIPLAGRGITPVTAGSLDGIIFRIDNPASDPIPLAEINPYAYPPGFTKIYLQNTAQAGKHLKLYVGNFDALANIELTSVTFAIDLVAQTIGDLSIDIAAQTVGNLDINIAASAITLNVDITAQTVGNINIDIAAQTVGNLAINLATSTIMMPVDIQSSYIMMPIDIQSSYIMMPVDIQGQYVTLDIDIVAQAVGNIDIDIAAQTVGNISVNLAASAITLAVDIKTQTVGSIDVDISAQTIGDLTISVDAQTVGVYLQPEWAALQGTDKNFWASDTGKAYTEEVRATYNLPDGKTLYVTGMSGSIWAETNTDFDHFFYFMARVQAIYGAGAVKYTTFGGIGGGFANFLKPIKIVASGEIVPVYFQIFNTSNLGANMEVAGWGYEL